MLSISYQNGRYIVNLPWKYDHGDVPNHLMLCESQLRSLLRKLQHKPDLLLEYDKIIQDQLKDGMVEIVDLDRMSTLSQAISIPSVHYMPHHGVTRQESQTTKLRIVYNGSARAYGGEPLLMIVYKLALITYQSCSISWSGFAGTRLLLRLTSKRLF